MISSFSRWQIELISNQFCGLNSSRWFEVFSSGLTSSQTSKLILFLFKRRIYRLHSLILKYSSRFFEHECFVFYCLSTFSSFYCLSLLMVFIIILIFLMSFQTESLYVLILFVRIMNQILCIFLQFFPEFS